MKILLTGHEYSKCIIPTSSWLWNKYASKEFDIKFLNFGDYKDQLFRGEFISLAEEQIGGKKAWGKYIYEYVKSLKDEYVILGCDDFLINSEIDFKRYEELKALLGGDVKSARLADVTWYKPSEYNCDANGIVSIKQTSGYLCTGQLTIWDKDVLLQILESGSDIWSFESAGSQKMVHNDWHVVASYIPPFKYHTISALSGGDNKVDLTGLTEEDKISVIKLIPNICTIKS